MVASMTLVSNKSGIKRLKISVELKSTRLITYLRRNCGRPSSPPTTPERDARDNRDNTNNLQQADFVLH